MSSVISSAVFARLRPQTPIVPWAAAAAYASFYLSARTSLGSLKKHRTTSHRSLITASAWHPLNLQAGRRDNGPGLIGGPGLAAPAASFMETPSPISSTTLAAQDEVHSPDNTLRGAVSTPIGLSTDREIVAERQRRSSAEIAIGMKDIGGEAGIKETLRNFYISSVDALPTKRVRRAVRRLCEEFLISPEGRRLSLEEIEIQKQLNLSTEILRLLVTRRLLRSENRSDSIYYELSHDALIEPVLATRRREALLFGWLVLGISSIGFSLVSLGVLL